MLEGSDRASAAESAHSPPTNFSGIIPYLPDVMRFLDALIMVGFGYVSYVFRHMRFTMDGPHVMTLCCGVLLFIVCANLLTTYHPSRLPDLRRQLLPMALASALALTALTALLFFAHLIGGFSRLWVGMWFVSAFIGMGILRWIMVQWTRRQYRAGAFARRIIVVGSADHVKKVVETMRKQPAVVTLSALYLTDDVPSHTAAMRDMGYPVLATMEQLAEYCRTADINEVLMTSGLESHPRMDEILSTMATLPCAVRYCIPIQFMGRPVADAELLSQVPVVTVLRVPLTSRQRLIKRLMDVVLSAIALLMLSPLLALVALLIALDGQGQIIFRQQRHGFGGGEFSILKFRSMKVAKSHEAEVKQATRDDNRITPIGAFIRRTSIDELPQLINVLMGDMSLVGPRPHALSHNRYYQQMIQSYAMRHRIKPGITGLAQVKGWRGETSTIEKMARRVEYDLHYIEHWSLWLDIKIMILTAFSFLAQKNAY